MLLPLRVGAKIVGSILLSVANVVFIEFFRIAGTGTNNILVITTEERPLANL